MPNLLETIDDFMAANALSERHFGLGAVNDKNLVRDLRSGRRVWPETEAKVRTFMTSYRAEAA